MDGCIYRTKDGECDLYADGGKFKAFCDMDGCEGRKMANADKIRAMTDEELAEFMERAGGCGAVFDKQYCNNRKCSETCWLDWLKQESTNEST